MLSYARDILKTNQWGNLRRMMIAVQRVLHLRRMIHMMKRQIQTSSHFLWGLTRYVWFPT